MRRGLISFLAASAVAAFSFGCGGGATPLSEPDAAKEQEKIADTAQKGGVPTGMPVEAMKTGNYPGMSQAGQQGQAAPAPGGGDMSKYYKK